ncbi:YraN family protein [Acinetobacter equi]|uniref:UPF0102 protein AOY20_09610 n=1 Tax=Acinetobacter equi TaxID=1324350 RepID=A0A0N9VX18_9GAMM|nr:YraN family protein [Acinetobacter equi]ALH95766.1 hypothetical protein AOY20_09610 [Acinetobacter equi]
MKVDQKMGAWAEQHALIYLQNLGYILVARNYYCRYGEIDLIVKNDSDLVFIEVKARSKTKYGQAIEVISFSKQKKIMRTALHFLNKNLQFSHYFCRFDVICFDFKHNFSKNVQQRFDDYVYDLNWIENAFTFEAEFINL